MQMAMPSRIFEDRLFFRKPASRPMKLPMIHATMVVIIDNPTVYGRFLAMMSLHGVG